METSILVLLLLVPACLAQNYTNIYAGYSTTGCDQSNEGNLYYITFMSNIPDQPKNPPIEIFVATAANQAQVTVETSAGYRETKTVQRNAIAYFALPRETTMLKDGRGKATRGCVVRVSSDQKIVVYGSNKEQYTTDAFLALPENVIGTQYYAVTWYPPSNYAQPDFCQIAIGGTREATIVEVTLPRIGGGVPQPTSFNVENLYPPITLPYSQPTCLPLTVTQAPPRVCQPYVPPQPVYVPPPVVEQPCGPAPANPCELPRELPSPPLPQPQPCGTQANPCAEPAPVPVYVPPVNPCVPTVTQPCVEPRVEVPVYVPPPVNPCVPTVTQPCVEPRTEVPVYVQPPVNPCVPTVTQPCVETKVQVTVYAPPVNPCVPPCQPQVPVTQPPCPTTGCPPAKPYNPPYVEPARLPWQPRPQAPPQTDPCAPTTTNPSPCGPQGVPAAAASVPYPRLSDFVGSFPFAEQRLAGDLNIYSAYIPKQYPGTGDADGYLRPNAPLPSYQPDQIPCQVEYNGRTYRNGETIQIQLQALEAVQLQAKCDLTGTFIKSSRPVSVFSGNARTAIGPGAITRDHVVEQIPPVPTWGRTFVTIPTPRRSVGDYYKIVASEDNTQVYLSGRGLECQQRTLNAGQFWQVDLPCQTYAYIVATKPVLVAHFTKSQTVGTEPADPAMTIIMPIEQFGTGYTFNTVEGVAVRYQNYMTLAVHRGKEQSLILDGVPVVPAEGWSEIPGTNVTTGYLMIQPGTHTVTSQNGDTRFAAYIYGAGDRESYAYPTGMCLKLLTCPSTPGCCCQRCDRGLGLF